MPGKVNYFSGGLGSVGGSMSFDNLYVFGLDLWWQVMNRDASLWYFGLNIYKKQGLL